MGKEDPFLKIGESNDRTQKGSGDVVYSLRDIDFSVSAGDTVGVIGRNGAGKSTLLKILPRVTSPSAGEVRIKGRIAKNGTKEANAAYHLQPSNNIDKITSWIIIWPFSLVENLLRDIINLVEEVPKTVLRKVYNYIYEQEINKI